MVLIASIAYGGWALTRSADRVETEVTVAERSQALADVADPLLALCQTDPSVRARVGSACQVAQAAVADPEVPTQGKPGADGARGDTGPAGAQGVQGVQGQTGPAGADGQNGSPGLTGPPGAAGADGKPGATGADGQTGAEGPAGVQGPQGEPGANGSPAGTFVLRGAGPGGSDLSCFRDGGPDTDPVYSCSQVSPMTEG